MGLSATPGRDLKSIGIVIENLSVSKVEARLDTDAEVKPYTHDRKYEVIIVDQPSEIIAIEKLHNILDVELYISIYKNFLKEENWEAGMRLLNRQNDLEDRAG